MGKEKREIGYINIYVSVAGNEMVCGRTIHKSLQDAENNQNCPAGYYWLNAIKQRTF